MWHSNQKEMLIGTNEPELKNLRVLFTIYTFFVCASIVMPQYFGVHIGYDITCARLSNLLFIGYIVFNPKILTHFFQTVVRCEVIYPLCLFLIKWMTPLIIRFVSRIIREMTAAHSSCIWASNWLIIRETGRLSVVARKDTAEMVIIQFTKK